MNSKIYEEYKPIVIFYKIGQDVCYEYNNDIQKVNFDTLYELKQQLIVPYKISFIGISRANIARILKDLKEENIDIFCYRVKNPKTNNLKYHAIFTEKSKIKKLEK